MLQVPKQLGSIQSPIVIVVDGANVPGGQPQLLAGECRAGVGGVDLAIDGDQSVTKIPVVGGEQGDERLRFGTGHLVSERIEFVDAERLVIIDVQAPQASCAVVDLSRNEFSVGVGIEPHEQFGRKRRGLGWDDDGEGRPQRALDDVGELDW